jgi:D-alanyl-D-alanine dipeptidase
MELNHLQFTVKKPEAFTNAERKRIEKECQETGQRNVLPELFENFDLKFYQNWFEAPDIEIPERNGRFNSAHQRGQTHDLTVNQYKVTKWPGMKVHQYEVGAWLSHKRRVDRVKDFVLT